MKNHRRVMSVVILGLWLAACQSILSPAATPLPGWRTPVSELFVDVSAFPDGWLVEFPEEVVTDPTISHVFQAWWHEGVSGLYDQHIWRAYDVADASEKYRELRKNQFPSQAPPSSGLAFIEFEPPDQIQFVSSNADEFYLACGQWVSRSCHVIAQYRNYVVLLRLGLAIEEVRRPLGDGLTYAQIETIVQSMDSKFVASQMLPRVKSPASPALYSPYTL